VEKRSNFFTHLIIISFPIIKRWYELFNVPHNGKEEETSLYISCLIHRMEWERILDARRFIISFFFPISFRTIWFFSFFIIIISISPLFDSVFSFCYASTTTRKHVH
jgi:hypothetical protein